MEEEEEDSTEEEDETVVVKYMDSDEEVEKKLMEVSKVERIEEEVEEEEEYALSPMEEWIPTDKPEHFTILSFQPVLLPLSSEAPNRPPARSTIVGRFGRSVIVGPSPRVPQWEERHSSSTMMMVTAEQLRNHLHREAKKVLARQKKRGPVRARNLSMDLELQAAVTPWIGNLLIPTKSRASGADALRGQGEKVKLSSTPLFLLLLQTMRVDADGCKKMIEQRKKEVVLLAAPQDPSTVKKRNPKTVAGMLQQKKAMEEEANRQQQVQRQAQQKQQLLLPQNQLVLMQPPRVLRPSAGMIVASTPSLFAPQQLNAAPLSTMTPILSLNKVSGVLGILVRITWMILLCLVLGLGNFAVCSFLKPGRLGVEQPTS